MLSSRKTTFACTRGLAAVVMILGGIGVPAWVYAGPTVPDVGRKEYPLDDAVVLRLDENWALQRDGSIRYEYHRWLKLLADRTFRYEGDPRIDFREGPDTLEIVTARTHLPDGSLLKVPDYSFNLVSPDGTAGWPAFVNERQWVVSFSSLVEDAVLELHYVRTSQPGSAPWVWGDLRLHDKYPVVQHNVNVILPPGQELQHRTDNLPAPMSSPKVTQDGKGTTWTWARARN